MAVNSIFTGVGLTGGPITNSGTISLIPATEVLLGGVTLVTSTSSTSTTQAATPAAVKMAYDTAVEASTTAASKLSLSGGTMTGPIVFAPGQTFNSLYLPTATSTTPGVVIPSTGLTISPGGYLTTVNNGTVTSITTGTGLGAPASGNAITSSGTINLLPPSSDGTKIGGVKAGNNISIQIDGEISTEGVLQTNNPYAYNAYVWPATTSPVPGAPGTDNQVLTLLNRVTGEIGWTSTGKINAVNAGAGLNAVTVNGVTTVSLASVSTPAATVGATALIPTFSFNSSGQIISHGLANPFSTFQNATVTAPPNLVLDFTDNNTNWQWTLTGNLSIQAPTNVQPGQRGSLILTQSPTPFVVTWHIAWKGIGAYTGPAAGQADLIDFVVVNGTKIVVTSIVTNVG